MQIEDFVDARNALDFFSIALGTTLEKRDPVIFNVNRESLFPIDVHYLAPAAAMIPMHAHLEILKIANEVFLKIERR